MGKKKNIKKKLAHTFVIGLVPIHGYMRMQCRWFIPTTYDTNASHLSRENI